MIDKILVLCPTRERPKEFANFVQSAARPLVDFAVYVACDDPKLGEYATLVHQKERFARIFIGPPLGYCRALNWLARENPGYAAYFTGEDDYTCINPDWAEIYLNELRRPGVHMVADDCESAHWPHTAAMSAKWLELVGGIQPSVPGVNHLAAYLWRPIAAATNCGAHIHDLCWHHNVPAAGSSWNYGEYGAEKARIDEYLKSPAYSELIAKFHAN